MSKQISESPLVNMLLADKRYIEMEGTTSSNASATRERHYKKMRYAVKQYGRLISSLSELSYGRASEYDREHSKSPAVWEPEAYIARRLASMHRLDPELLNETEYRQLVEAVNKSLRFMTVKWTDWEDMLALLKLYLLRAEVAADRGLEEEAIADLHHAAAVLKHYAGDPEVMIKYFVDEEKKLNKAEEGQQLLLKMLWLQVELLSKHVKSYVVKSPIACGINGRADVYQAIEAIRVHDNLYETLINKQQSKEEQPWLAPGAGNIQMTEKATLTSDPSRGRCWKAIEAIEEGETIMFERPQVMVLFEEQFGTYCDHCHRKQVTFWPCAGCSELTYCSADCAQAAFKHYHQTECGIYGFIMNEGNYNAALAYRHYATFGVPMTTQCEEEVAQAEKSVETDQLVAEFFASEAIHSKPYCQLAKKEKKMLCKALTGQLSNRGQHLPVNEIYQTVRAITLVECLFYKGAISRKLFLDTKQYAALLEHMAMSIMRTVTNAFSWDQTPEDDEDDEEAEKARVGCATSLQASLFNHSCDPNVAWTITDGVLHMEALRLIEPGEELTISYGPRQHSSLYNRQLRLRRDYIFFCRCELCRFEASASELTLACQAPPNSSTGQNQSSGALCPGPLILSVHRACLLCKYQPSEARCQRVAATGEAASTELMRLFQGLYRPKGSKWTVKATAVTAARSARILQAIGIWRKGSKRNADNVQVPLPEEDVSICPASKKQIAQLEKQFDICSKVFYGGSLHMIEKCAMLLKVYSDLKLYHRGFRLLEPLSRCLEAIIPSRIDANQGKVLYMLDFAIDFYEHLACSPIDLHLSGAFWELATLRQQLNSTLLQILQFDRHHRGDFFPQSYQLGEEANFDAEEGHFRQMLDDCYRRHENSAMLQNVD